MYEALFFIGIMYFGVVFGALVMVIGKPLKEAIPNFDIGIAAKEIFLALIALLGSDDEVNKQIALLNLEKKLKVMRFLTSTAAIVFVLIFMSHLL